MTRTREASIYLFGQLFAQALTFVIGTVIARKLGATDYGVLSLANRIFAVCMLFAPLGLDLGLLKYLGGHRHELADALGTTKAVRQLVFCITTLLALLTGLAGGFLLERFVYRIPHLHLFIAVTMVGLPFAVDAALQGAIFRGIQRPWLQNLITLFGQPIVRAIVIFSLLQLGFGTLGVIGANVFVVTAASLSLSWALAAATRSGPGASPLITPEMRQASRRLVKTSLPLASLLLTYGVLRSVDLMILGAYATERQIGEYAALGVIAQLIQILPQAVSQTLGPRVSAAHAAGDEDQIRQMLNGYLRLAVLITSPCFAAVAIFAPWLQLLFGPTFAFDSGLAFCLAGAYMLSAVFGPMGYALSMTGRHRAEFFVLASGLALTVLCCFLLIPRFGPIGAALSVAAGYFYIEAVRTFLTAQLLSFIPGRIRDVFPPLACLLMAWGIRFVAGSQPHDLTRSALAVVAYAGMVALIYWLLIFDAEERRSLRRLLGQAIGRLRSREPT